WIEFSSRSLLTIPSYYVFTAFYYIVKGTYKIQIHSLNTNRKSSNFLNENDILKNKFSLKLVDFFNYDEIEKLIFSNEALFNNRG
ncbi:MAG: hypothetical protein LCH30_11470, partial [Proteobacteria bacterium]|nr:hypothetical protein [Pseudomonadota bacterium]